MYAIRHRLLLVIVAVAVVYGPVGFALERPAAAVAETTTATSGPTYAITNLGTLTADFRCHSSNPQDPPGPYSFALALNDAGDVVGESCASPGFFQVVTHSFLYRAGAMTDLGALGPGCAVANCWHSFGRGINGADQVVGSSGPSQLFPGTAFLYARGAMTSLLPEAALGDASAINDAGQVVGWFSTSPFGGPERAFINQGGMTTELGGLGGTRSLAVGINRSGHVTGYASISGDVSFHAFLYADGVMRDLGTLGGGRSFASSINSTDQVVGRSDTAGGEEHAFLWSNGAMIDLSALLGRSLIPWGINDAGQVVGSVSTTSGAHAFVYSSREFTDLNDVIGTGSGWVLTEARAINRSGQIVGTGIFAGERRAFLLTPSAKPPLITVTQDPLPNPAGWNNSDVTVTWSVSDPGSGGVSSTGCGQTTLTQETSGTTLTCSAQNGVGLSASRSVIIKIDKTAPTITFSGNAGTYTVDQTILITCSASDALSGIATTSCPAVASGPATNFVGTTAMTSTTLTALGSDNAGNSASASSTFTVVVDADGICRLAASLRTADAICAHVRSIAAAPNATAKSGKLKAFDHFLAAQSGKSIPADLATLLSRLAHLPAGVAAATLGSLSPASGTAAGGTTVLVTGAGIICGPSLPAVSFGGTDAALVSCATTSVTATSPAHPAGAVPVTLTNSGGPASNGLSYTYVAPVGPAFAGQSTALNIVTVSYSTPVCRTAPANQVDWTVKNLATGFVDLVIGDSTPICNISFSNAVTSARLFLVLPLPAGALAEVQLNELVAGAGNNPDIRDAAGNLIRAPQVQTVAATDPPTTPPTITSALGTVGAALVTINFSEPVFCPTPVFVGQFALNSGNPAASDPTFTGFNPARPCAPTQTTATSSFALQTNTPLPANTNYTLTFRPFANNEIENVYLVSLVNPPGTVSITFNTGPSGP
jgi:probable HAF family extracellular repeat protein